MAEQAKKATKGGAAKAKGEKPAGAKAAAGAKPAPGAKPVPAPKVEIVEKQERGPHKARPQAKITPEQARTMALRRRISDRRPTFRRTEWFRYKKLSRTGYRRGKGLGNKMRIGFSYRTPVVSIGFRGPAATRGLHPSGFREVLVHNEKELAGLDPKTQAVRIGGTVGSKKRSVLEGKAKELGLRVLNPSR